MKTMTKKKPLKVIGTVLLVLVAAGAIGTAIYRDDNLHGDERAIDRALAAGFSEKQVQVDGATINYAEGPDKGFAEKQVQVDGATVNYAEGPDNGPALLLVHGQGMEWEDYATVLPELSKRYHVFAVDCFGHGKSAHDPVLYTCSTGGDALIAFAEQVIDGDYLVSGHSSGGVLAAYVAAHDSEHVIACVLEVSM